MNGERKALAQASLLGLLLMTGCTTVEHRPAASEVHVVACNEPRPAQPVVAACPRGEAPPARRSFVDITAQPSFAHAEDYSWLVGQVEYSCIRKGWRIRYASVDEDDRYGGSATLADEGQLGNLKDGQLVRLTGHFVGGEGKAIAVHYQAGGEGQGNAVRYQVTAIEPIKP